MTATGHVLCVDDEQNVLDGLRRTLHGRFQLTTTTSPDQALALVADRAEELDVIVSDLKMPGMNGIALLSEVRRIAPDSVRVLLTGEADLQVAMDAVNRGNVFQFLCKPVSREELVASLDAALVQRRLIVAEHELLEQTLKGSVAALVEMLALASPTAFARTDRIKRTVMALAEHHGIAGWEIEVAAMLAQLGAVTLSPELLAKLDSGKPLDRDERATVSRLPLTAEKLLRGIPRLEHVCHIIHYQGKWYDGRGVPEDDVAGEDIPLASRMIRLATDLDINEAAGMGWEHALSVLHRRRVRYDPVLLEELPAILQRESEGEMQEFDVAQIVPGMIIAEDVRDEHDRLLLSRGREITESLLQVIRNYAERDRIGRRLRVTEPGGP
jgi:response regulator RpfG family c-di-GMP phosphodiesterase